VIHVGVKARAGLYLAGSVTAGIGIKPTLNWFAGAKASMVDYANLSAFGFANIPIWNYPRWSHNWPITKGSASFQ